MDMRQLDSFSRSMAELFLEAYPEWRDCFSRDPDSDDTLLIRVPSPAPATGRALSIYTDNEELTVAFDSYHTHIDWAGPLC
jgi:hypothetical protein